tara:strand:- start:9 stop:197 length:189 start_codon:yes stop_codon:yes gene_type:complete
MNNKQYLKTIIDDCEKQINVISDRLRQAQADGNIEEINAFKSKRSKYNFMKDRLRFKYLTKL